MSAFFWSATFLTFAFLSGVYALASVGSPAAMIGKAALVMFALLFAAMLPFDYRAARRRRAIR